MKFPFRSHTLRQQALPQILLSAVVATTFYILAPDATAQPRERPRLKVKPQTTVKPEANNTKPEITTAKPEITAVKTLPAGITLERANAHVIAPANIENIEIEEVNPAREFKLVLPKKPLKSLSKPKLDVNGFGETIHEALKDSVNGYVLQVRKNGQAIYGLQWRYAQRPVDGTKNWNADESMHIASVSKFLTALGMVKALDQAGVSLDAKILPFLPTYWKKGNNIEDISFRNLLNHDSGLDTGGSKSDFGTMKAIIAKNSPGVSTDSPYQNVNFGLCRILIPTVLGQIDPDSNFMPGYTTLNDRFWDIVTGTKYKEWMQSKVFGPSGVSGVGYTPPGNEMSALAYKFPAGSAKGWNSGDLTSMAGGAGWRMSTNQLLKIMYTARHTNSIMPKTRVQYMLDNRLGIDQVIDTPAGKTYNKNGRWTNNERTEQCVAYFLPDGMEVTVFVNSFIGPNKASLRGLVQDSFEANLKD